MRLDALKGPPPRNNSWRRLLCTGAANVAQHQLAYNRVLVDMPNGRVIPARNLFTRTDDVAARLQADAARSSTRGWFGSEKWVAADRNNAGTSISGVNPKLNPVDEFSWDKFAGS